MLFVALSLRAVSPKKDAASRGPRFGTFPCDPSLKALTAAGEIREERTPGHTYTLPHSNAAGLDRSGSDWSGLSSEAPFDKTQYIQTPSPSEDHLDWEFPMTPYVCGAPATSQWNLSSVGNLYPHTATSLWGPD